MFNSLAIKPVKGFLFISLGLNFLVILRRNGKFGYDGKKREYLDDFRKKGRFWFLFGKIFFSEKGRLEGTMGKFCDFISEKGRLQGTSENFEKNKVQREKWPVPSNGPPL